TGPLGLAGIPELRQLDPPPAGSKATRVPGTRGSLFLLRPLLGTPKSRIEEARRALELPCLDDPSNRDPGLTPRNRIRHQILPALRARRPGALEALLDAARGLRHAAECEIAGFDGPRDGHADLPLAELQALSPWALELLWTRLLDALGKERPSRAKLRFLRELSGAARSGKRVESLGHWQAVRLRDRVRLCDWETD
ncbi:MAG: ATP-binding protein, partial [Planctomycetota bacterium]